MKKRFVFLAIKILVSIIIYAFTVSYISQIYNQNKISPEIEGVFNAIKSGNVNAKLPTYHISVSTWSTELKEKIKKHNYISFTSGDDIYYYQLLDNFIYELGPIKIEDQKLQVLTLNLIYYLGVIIIILMWLRPLLFDLFVLDSNTRGFADGKVLVHTKLKNTSSIFPLGKTFNQMATKLFHLMQLQKSVARMVGHEIRTPLTRIQMSISLLKPELEENIEELDSIQEDISEIANLTEEFLNLTRYEHFQDELPISIIDPKKIVTEIVSGFNKVSNNKIKIISDGDIKVMAEPVSFKRLIQNLLGNAIKYGKDEIVINLTQREHNNYCISVEDNGKGFINLNSVSSAYYQESIDSEGFGLGLSIATMIASWHKGTIVLDKSYSLGGAQVSFIWPINLN